jgi:hypothetical protein
MTNIKYTDPLNKVCQYQDQNIIDLVKEIRVLRNEVHSLQVSVNIILRRLPEIVHDELVAHEPKRYFQWRRSSN